MNVLQAQDTLHHVQRYIEINDNTLGYPWSVVQGMESTIAGIGDIDGNGVVDMAVGYPELDGGRGRVGIVLFENDYAIRGFNWIGNALGDLPWSLDSLDGFGAAIATVGDLNGDEVPDIAVLADGSDLTSADHGAVHILFLDEDGKVDSATTITPSDHLALGPIRSLSAGGDLNGDGVPDLLLGFPSYSSGGNARGALLAVLLTSEGNILNERIYSAQSSWPGSSPLVTDSLYFGSSSIGLGDIDSDGIADIAVSIPGANMIATLLLNGNGTIKEWFSTIDELPAGTTAAPSFGRSLARLPDLDHNGVPELLIGDPGLIVSTNASGGALYLNAFGADQPEGTKFLVNGRTTAGDHFDLRANARAGHTVGVLGDADGDGLPEIILSAPNQWPMEKPRFYIIHTEPAPLAIHLTIKDQTQDSLGSVALRISGGIPPYQIQWSPELFDPGYFEALISEIDTFGLGALGVPQPINVELTAEELIGLAQTDLDGISAGLYWIGVEDSLKTQAEQEFAVGLAIQTLVEVGTTSSEDNKDIKKVGGDGWTNMELQTKNVLPKQEDGWLRFRVSGSSPVLAIGFRDIDAPNEGGKDDLLYAFYFEDDRFNFWYNKQRSREPEQYEPNDVFQIARVGKSILFQKNEHTFFEIEGISPKFALSIGAAIYTEEAGITDITTNFRSSFSIAPTVVHTAPLSPGSGNIDVDLPESLGPYTYTWSATGGNVATISEVDPGEYALTVSSGLFDHTATRIFRVGHQLFWSDSTLSPSSEGIGTTVINPAQSTAGWQRSMSSINMIRYGAGHYIKFRPYPSDDPEYGSIVGLRSQGDDRMWAGWWTYTLGTTHIAQTISRSGTSKRIIVDRADELEIVLHAYSINFLKNGELVLQVPRYSEQASNVCIALRSEDSMVKDLMTSIPVPIELNTTLLSSVQEFVFVTPDGSRATQLTGKAHQLELDATLGAGPYTLSSQPTTLDPSITFDLSQGEATLVTYKLGGVVQTLDSSLFEFRGMNEIVLYEEPGVLGTSVSAPFKLSLQDQLLMTPDADGSHDTFKVIGTVDPASFELIIRDLDDNLLFQTNDQNQAWNGSFMNTGSAAPAGIYNYSIVQPSGNINGQFMLIR